MRTCPSPLSACPRACAMAANSVCNVEQLSGVCHMCSSSLETKAAPLCPEIGSSDPSVKYTRLCWVLRSLIARSACCWILAASEVTFLACSAPFLKNTLGAIQGGCGVQSGEGVSLPCKRCVVVDILLTASAVLCTQLFLLKRSLICSVVAWIFLVNGTRCVLALMRAARHAAFLSILMQTGSICVSNWRLAILVHIGTPTI